MRRAGARQNGDISGVTPFLVNHETPPPPLFVPASAVLSIRKTEKLSDGVTAVSGTVGVSHVSVKQRMFVTQMIDSGRRRREPANIQNTFNQINKHK